MRNSLDLAWPPHAPFLLYRRSCTALVEDARGRLQIVHWTSFAAQQERISHHAPARLPAAYAGA